MHLKKTETILPISALNEVFVGDDFQKRLTTLETQPLGSCQEGRTSCFYHRFCFEQLFE